MAASTHTLSHRGHRHQVQPPTPQRGEACDRLSRRERVRVRVALGLFSAWTSLTPHPLTEGEGA